MGQDKAHSAANVETLARDATQAWRMSSVPEGRVVQGAENMRINRTGH